MHRKCGKLVTLLQRARLLLSMENQRLINVIRWDSMEKLNGDFDYSLGVKSIKLEYARSSEVAEDMDAVSESIVRDWRPDLVGVDEYRYSSLPFSIPRSLFTYKGGYDGLHPIRTSNHVWGMA